MNLLALNHATSTNPEGQRCAYSATCDSLPQIGPRGAIRAGGGGWSADYGDGGRGDGDDDLNERLLPLSFLLKSDDELLGRRDAKAWVLRYK